ncbi:type I-D CRISPR-associated helicase Cas3' [Roseofilum sp. BLCC_M91]|uniref:Type I-D CRISPR-associated helicase Cas3 n=1 Tax=Roseofilum halophilum BLCC-M91 TaxID=3022259 RepID=A0ABT7BM30_9CYAN|nr:type I-D CRISPR-associated helicase Cas3' [Roseofilum halophilum]MDJ1180258.1 type I-D CRISPR-associated helicase Cas3' [Roseofilum halophilum BLCC-M91]
MINLNILPVALEQIKTDEWLAGKHPYQYQWEAYKLISEAFESKRTLCLFLITPTGSGKTLTSYGYSINTGKPMFGVYPTNELLADQERTLLEEYEKVGSNRVIRVDSKALDEWQINLELQRHSQTLETLLNYKPVLLTNPDILFYVAFGLYPKINSLRQRLWELVGSYRLFAFDEFHLYNVKQQADTAYFVGALNAINSEVGRVFIFASATPNLEMVNLLRDKLGLWVEVVESHPSDNPDARIIAHPVNLKLVPAELNRWQGLQALDESFDEIESFNQQYSDARYVAIFDSVAAAIGAAKRFINAFDFDLVGEIHGLSSTVMRQEALAKKVTIGTSTIEVGVDFKNKFEKDFLTLEARTSSQFIQRFGRIARHSKSLSIPNEVLALVPDYVYNFLGEKTQSNPTLTRDELRELIEEAYRQPQEFKGYLAKHACVEMIEATNLVLAMFQPDTKPQIKEEITKVIENLTGKDYSKAQKKRWRYENELILKPLLTFRGNGFEAAIIDERDDKDIGFPVKRYNLMFLLRRGVFQELDEKTFVAKLDNICSGKPEWFYEVQREKRFAKLIESSPEKLLGVYGFLKLIGLIDESQKTRQVWFEIPEDNISGKVGQVTTFKDLEIKTHPKIPIRLLQRTLNRKTFVAWVIDSHPKAIKLGRALPPLFEVYELKVILPGGSLSSQSWSIAFNQDAFFLDSLYWNLKK